MASLPLTEEQRSWIIEQLKKQPRPRDKEIASEFHVVWNRQVAGTTVLAYRHRLDGRQSATATRDRSVRKLEPFRAVNDIEMALEGLHIELVRSKEEKACLQKENDELQFRIKNLEAQLIEYKGIKVHEPKMKKLVSLGKELYEKHIPVA